MGHHGNIFISFVQAVSSLFNSMYETFVPLTSVNPQHFVEWFSGTAIDSIWTQRNVVGSPTFQMSDDVNQGFEIITPNLPNKIGQIDFNDKRHYAHDNCILIAIMQTLTTTLNNTQVGLTNDAAGIANDSAFVENFSSNTNFTLGTLDATTFSRTEGSVPIDTNPHSIKIECGSANIKSYIDGVLDVTKESNRPTTKMQPYFNQQATSNNSRTGRIRFLEAFNTDVTILSSLYERLFALTEVMKQRVVETFVGAVVDSNRWTKTDIAGTNTNAMVDAADEGYEIVSSAVANDETQINFNNKRQYAHDDSIAIFTLRALSNTSAISYGGFSGNQLAFDGVEKALVVISSANTNISLRTADGATSSEDTATGVPIDTAWHVYKIETSSANIKLYSDGVLSSTKTTNRPTTKMQPCIGVKTLTTAAKTTRIRSFECFNKGTAPITESVYELFDEPTTVAKSHDWSWMGGSSLESKWNFTDIVGTGSGAISDSVNGGYEITTGATDDDESSINSNDKRQYAQTASVVILEASAVANSRFRAGFSENTDMSNSFALVDMDADNTFYELTTDDGTTESSSASTIPIDTNYHSHKIECGSANIKLTIDGVLDVTKESNRPDQPQQQFFAVKARSAGAKTGNLRYCEARNI